MASGLFSPLITSFPAPAAILAQLTISSAATGLTHPDSITRKAALPFVAGCVYSIVTNSKGQMRPRWASLLGGASFMFFLQYIDLGLVAKWNFEDNGPARQSGPLDKERLKNGDRSSTSLVSEQLSDNDESWWTRFRWGWSRVLALRHVNTSHEARNTPTFTSDPSYVPSKSRFLLREIPVGIICYLLLDLMAQRASSPMAPKIFDKSLIPVFRRFGDVTLSQIKLRALSITGFALTFWALIRGYAAAAGAVTVSLGLNEPRDWRPPFGSITDAYSIQNLWGKVWHQNLRSLLTGPAAKLTYDVLQLRKGGLPARILSVLTAFALSGAMHTCASMAAGMSPHEFGVMQFFCTQALGVLIEDSVRLAYLRAQKYDGREKLEPPPLLKRCVGYVWVAAFMIWSGPVWLYPQASKLPPPGTNGSFLPYSVVRALKAGDLDAGF